MQKINTAIPYIHRTSEHNLVAPEIIVPVLLKLFSPKSVIDIGCGIGTFLHVFEKYGINDVFGIDGNWVNLNQLYIAKEKFLERDLEQAFTVAKQYDLVLCLEVAEHLSENSSDIIVNTLVNSGKVIIFSAAVPGQGGFKHINEQYHHYWQTKFAKHEYIYYDIFRPRFWNNESINWWYKQNMFLVAHKSVQFSEEIMASKADKNILTYIHPELLAVHDNEYKKKIKRILEKERSRGILSRIFNQKINHD